MATDPNLVASYVDNDLDADQVAEYEKKCLTSDVNLAEVACVHQILSLLGQKVQVPPEAKARMYQLVRGRESIPPPRSDGVKPRPKEPVTRPIQPWVAPEPPPRHWLERFGPVAGCLALIGILSWSAYQSLTPVGPDNTIGDSSTSGDCAAVARCCRARASHGDRQSTNDRPAPPACTAADSHGRTHKGGHPRSAREPRARPRDSRQLIQGRHVHLQARTCGSSCPARWGRGRCRQGGRHLAPVQWRQAGMGANCRRCAAGRLGPPPLARAVP